MKPGQWDAAWESQGKSEVEQAFWLLHRDRSDYGHLPWPSLDGIVKGIARGKLWYVVMASNNGKTTFVYSLVEALLAQKKPVFVMSTETTPQQFRLALEALTLGIDPGILETGEVLDLENSMDIRSKLVDQLAKNSARNDDRHKLIQFPWEGGFLTSQGILEAAERAHEQGAEWFIVDHVDHINPVGPGGEIAQSNAVNAALHEACLQFKLRAIATSQMNQRPFQVLKKMALLSVPIEDWVKYGGTKKQFADGMLGGYRPLRSPKPEKAQIDAYEQGELPLSEIAMPNAMRLIVMKHRAQGKLVGQKVTLDVLHGRVMEPSYYERGALEHGIRTSRTF